MILRLIVYRESPKIIMRAGVAWPKPETQTEWDIFNVQSLIDRARMLARAFLKGKRAMERSVAVQNIYLWIIFFRA